MPIPPRARKAATEALKRRVVGVVVLFVLVSAVGLLCRPPKDAPLMRPPVVRVVVPAVAERIDYDEYAGRLEAGNAFEVRARVSGKLIECAAKDGAFVRRGDPLFVVDPQPFETAVSHAKQELAGDEARALLAERKREEAVELVRQQVLSPAELDARVAAKQLADARVALARANLEAAQLDLSFCRIEAPSDGQLTLLYPKSGDSLQPDSIHGNVLATIVPTDPIYAVVDVDQQSVLKYEALHRAGLRPSARESRVQMMMGLPSDDGFPHEGWIQFVENRFDPDSGMMRVRGEFANDRNELRAGEKVRVCIPASGRYQALLLPESAICSGHDGSLVWILGDGDVIASRKIAVGDREKGMRVVREGIASADRVVDEPLPTFQPGLHVEPLHLEAVATSETLSVTKTK